MSYFYILFAILLTVYGQLVIKWQALDAGIFPEDSTENKVWFMLHLECAMARSIENVPLCRLKIEEPFETTGLRRA
jgi:hypothetical protein